jgi:DNA-binding NtrC family response regulator
VKSTVCVVDDDDQLRKSFQRLLTDEGYRVLSAGSGEEGIEIVREKVTDLVILDMKLPGISGLEAFSIIHQIDAKLPVIIMTAYGTTETAIEAIRQGAFDYVLKPFEVPDMLDVIQKALEAGRFMRHPVEVGVPPGKARREAIIGKSPAMQEVYKAIGRVSPTDATVLIRGESGTGKELVARALYQYSSRADCPFQVINCVAIPETLLESELFGYEKGAFTGANHRRVGKLERASSGTVFLDEIGDMPPSLQSKILRLLQEKSIERLGGRQTLPVDVRMIAATNRDLEKAIAEGRFREDLYYRLKVVTIRLPALRNRREDIPLLTEHFLAMFAREMGVENPGVSADALQMLQQLPWRGNVRELANTLQKALIFSRGTPLSADDVCQAAGEGAETAQTETESTEAVRRWVRRRLSQRSGDSLFEAVVDEVSAMLVREAILFTDGNRSQAARLLGLSRPTLHAKIEKYGLKFETRPLQET